MFPSLQQEVIILWIKRDDAPSKLLMHLTNGDDDYDIFVMEHFKHLHTI